MSGDRISRKSLTYTDAVVIYEIRHLFKGAINFIAVYHFLNELPLKTPLLSCRRTRVLKLKATDLE